MSASELAGYLRRIRLSYSVSELHALVGDIERQFGDDEATPRLQSVIAAKREYAAFVHRVIRWAEMVRGRRSA